jgi:hypothetical protein
MLGLAGFDWLVLDANGRTTYHAYPTADGAEGQLQRAGIDVFRQ